MLIEQNSEFELSGSCLLALGSPKTGMFLWQNKYLQHNSSKLFIIYR